jgi:hypothetical protein
MYRKYCIFYRFSSKYGKGILLRIGHDAIFVKTKFLRSAPLFWKKQHQFQEIIFMQDEVFPQSLIWLRKDSYLFFVSGNTGKDHWNNWNFYRDALTKRFRDRVCKKIFGRNLFPFISQSYFIKYHSFDSWNDYKRPGNNRRWYQRFVYFNASDILINGCNTVKKSGE